MDTSQRRVGLFGERYTSMASWSYHAWRWLFWPFCGRVTHWSPGTTQVDVCWLKQCRAGGVKTNLVHTSLSLITVVWSGLETAARPVRRPEHEIDTIDFDTSARWRRSLERYTINVINIADPHDRTLARPVTSARSVDLFLLRSTSHNSRVEYNAKI